VTSHTRIRDLVVHEEYRNYGAGPLLNDLGRVAGQLPARGCLADMAVASVGFQLLSYGT
jgi:hypothetical protein